MSTDGVGSKLVVAEQADRLETVGIDCIAMNVNDVVCVGAEPIAMLDYLAVEQADPDALARIGEGLRAGAEQANVEIPGGELAVLPELIRGHPSPRGFDLCGTAIGTVALDAIVTGDDVGARRRARRPALERPALQRLHARPPRAARGGRPRASTTARRSSAARRSPTRCSSRPSSTCARCSTCCAPGIAVHGLAHITGGGVQQPPAPRRRAASASRSRSRCPRRRSSGSWPGLGDVPTAEMWDVFNMGCGFVAVVPAEQADEAAAIAAARHPGSARIGTVTAEGGRVTVAGV